MCRTIMAWLAKRVVIGVGIAVVLAVAAIVLDDIHFYVRAFLGE